ncbi:MFS transporter [Candidatus Binatus sp.]|jgi:ACS family tartrate transporter-like MFS transporter|uniref:MFS transporter n=1 Tax=Candidatus Binatus sp. TaxID=2811406 RepID=UPI003CC0C200
MPHAEYDRSVKEVRSIETADESRLADAALSKARRRLLPFLFVLYLVAYLDRINVGFASLQMNRELGLSESVFGLGAGLFFIGYSIFEVPSNLILARVGARLWIARIMISWGVVAMAMIAVRGAASFFALRFILGLAEAGFFPGVILYLTFWFPAREQARAVALFMTASALAGVIAGPVSGGLLELHGLAGLSGWQWLFILEGLPAVILGVWVLRYLPEGPKDAAWLEVGERAALLMRLERERRRGTQKRQNSFAEAISNSTVWILSLVYFAIVFGLYGVTFWLPQIIQSFGNRSDVEIGMLSAIPFFGAAVAMVFVGRASDLSGERRWHLAFCAAVGAIGLMLAATTRSPLLSLAALSIAAAGIWGTFGPFWAMPPEFLSGTAAAGAIALINSIGNLGGFAGPYAVGIVKQATHSFAGGMIAMAAALVAGGMLALTLPVPLRETDES